MDQFLASLPKTVIALGAIVIGFILIRIYDPPRTICDAQMEIFKESQQRFLYRKNEEGMGQPSLVTQLHAMCKGEASPGGCFEFFEGLKRLNMDLKNVPEHCSEVAGDTPEIRKWLDESLKLMTLIAWGDRMPASQNVKNGWFDASELVLFCDLKKSAVRIYGADEYAIWREEYIRSLPESEKLTREVLWQRSLLSTPCDAYR